MADSEEIIRLGHRVLESEINALVQLRDRLDETFAQAVHAILNCKGTVVLSGVGKPYFIAQKISASMASTGTPSIALHPVDALHGDMGRIRPGDIVILLSNSGSSSEMVDFARAIKALDVTMVAMTCRPQSAMAASCDLVLDLGQLEEACPMGVAPSTTSTAMLALGDALTLALVDLRGFTIDSFARNHPAGSLGKRLSPVTTMMRDIDATAVVRPNQTILDTLGVIAQRRCGAAFVVDEAGALVGIFTDGDVRRLLTQKPDALSDLIVHSMTSNPKTVLESASVELALDQLRTLQINCLGVVNAKGQLIGHLDIQDLV